VSTALYGVVSGLFGFIHLVVYVAFLIVAMTAIRTRRPDAFLPFTIAAAMFLLQTVVSFIGPMLVSGFVPRSGVSSTGYMGMFSIVSAVGTIMSTFAWILMLMGLVKIASPPQELDPNRPPGL
jgi:hypothetical protein